jgi:hypothetical protein
MTYRKGDCVEVLGLLTGVIREIHDGLNGETIYDIDVEGIPDGYASRFYASGAELNGADPSVVATDVLRAVRRHVEEEGGTVADLPIELIAQTIRMSVR